MFSSQSSNISNAVYESNWMEGDTTYKKGLLMILIRARKPLILTGLKYTTVNLRGFTKVSEAVLKYRSAKHLKEPFLFQILSSSYSYFALIRTMYIRM